MKRNQTEHRKKRILMIAYNERKVEWKNQRKKKNNKIDVKEMKWAFFSLEILFPLGSYGPNIESIKNAWLLPRIQNVYGS